MESYPDYTGANLKNNKFKKEDNANENFWEL